MPKINPASDREFQSFVRQAAPRPKKKKRRATDVYEDPDYVSLGMDPDFVRGEEEEDEGEEDDAFLFVRDLSSPGPGLVARPGAYLLLPGTSGNYASTPDSAAVSVTGDIDIRCKVAADDWTPANFDAFMSKWQSNNYAFYFGIDPGGQLRLGWSTTGLGETHSTISTASVGAANGAAKWVRAALDVNDGAGNHVLNFYTSDDGATWSPLGDTVTAAGTVSIADTAAGVEIGTTDAGAGNFFAGKVYYAEVRNGIGGTVVAKFNPAETHQGVRSFTSSTGEVWTVNGGAAKIE